MHDESNPRNPEATEQAILGMLLRTDALWSVHEVAREVGDDTAAHDGIANLYGAGLVHRCGEFVFVTRAAARAAQIGA
jgi:hypothetical protein